MVDTIVSKVSPSVPLLSLNRENSEKSKAFLAKSNKSIEDIVCCFLYCNNIFIMIPFTRQCKICEQI